MLANSGSNQSQSHPITVTFDENAKTLQAQDGNQNYQFQNVSISNIAISGDVDTISIGIDRSSLGLVWQQYGSDKPVIAYGQCRPSSASAGGH